MLLVLLSLTTLLSPDKAQYNIKNFQNQAGIFFDKVAKVGIPSHSWNFIVHINMTEYGAAKKSLDEAMKSISKLGVRMQYIYHQQVKI